MILYVLNSFAKTKTGGNPAGVCLDADELTAKQMQAIAAKINLETAFVQKSRKADFKVRFFCPTGEVDLCGHDTIALFILMTAKGLVTKGNYAQETKAGILEIEVRDEKTVLMQQNNPLFSEVLDKRMVAQALRIPISKIGKLQPQVVSTGVRDILVEVADLPTLLRMTPDFKAITTLSKEFRTIGLHAFSMETKHGATAHCRNFAPLYGINEESGTGTSNGALACYLYKYGRIAKTDNLRFEQGYSMKQPSEILVKLETTGKKIVKVQVGGTAIIVKEIELPRFGR